MTDVLLRRYTFKLYPTAAQETASREQLLMMGQLWNALLQQRELAAEGIYRRLLDCMRPPPRLIIEGEMPEERKLRLRKQDQERRARQKAAREAGTAIKVAYKGKGGRGAIIQSQEITNLRAQCPEWSAFSVAAARGVADRLDNAFKAFFRRAKAGAGAQSGYPRYRRPDRWSSISFTECSGSGWRIWQEKPGKGGWRVYVKGVTGQIKARGLLPAEPKSWRTGEIIWRDGAWWLSVVCEMEPRRKAGNERISVSFDLIDEFAVVEAVDGRFPTGSKEQAPPNISTRCAGAPADTPGSDGNAMSTASVANTSDLGDDGNGAGLRSRKRNPADIPDLGSDGNPASHVLRAKSPADTPNLGGDGNRPARRRWARKPADTLGWGDDGNAAALVAPADAPDLIQSSRDRRYVKFSWRWRREKKRIARIKARDARRRRYIHHGWSTTLVRQARDLTVSVPSISQWTESPRGNARNWGANVAVVSSLNRHILGQAPMLAVSMLQYKAAEAGIRCDVVKDDEAPDIAVGRDMVVVGKVKRRLRRAIKKEAA